MLGSWMKVSRTPWMTLKVAEAVGLIIYDEVRTRIQTQVRIVPGT
jgi:hypothetical protein